MMLTESDARQVLEVIRGRLEEIGAKEILDGIEESRRLGVEESLSEQGAKEIKQVGAMRRRPLSAIEELTIVFQRLQERLVVMPRLAASIQERLKANAVEWRVDTEFVSASRIPEVTIASLAPDGHETLNERITEIMKVADLSPAAREE
jgi:hypothetical protein